MKTKKAAATKEEAKPAESAGNGIVEKDGVFTYSFKVGHTLVQASIFKKPGERIFTYSLSIPELEEGTVAFLDEIKAKLLKQIKISHEEALDIRMAEQLQLKVIELAKKVIKEEMPHLSDRKLNFVAEKITQEMLGLGEIELLLKDDYIEEICVDNAKEPIWIYHKQLGWMKTNLRIPSENDILNYASSIARKVGRQINTQSPLLDAYLVTGDRVNATIYPISSFGNTITIRKFARKPWTVIDYMRLKTISSELAALLWLAIQYEMSIVVAGGTGAGKTSLLNVLCAFMPQNQRIVSIEQTREITLPSYYQWVPMVVREGTSEGRGEVSMLDLMVNSLRMRPDRIIIGEIRRAEEAQVLFEAMHTGHSVYATLHAETVDEAFRRLKNPPINIPSTMLSSLHIVLAAYRNRRTGIRRVFEMGEVIAEDKNNPARANILYKWNPSTDKIMKAEKSKRILNYIKLFTNMSDADISKALKERQRILEWMLKKNINTVEAVGDIISRYYDNPAEVVKMVNEG
jgi:flagellar protein FlaI